MFLLRILVPVLTAGHWFLVVVDIKNSRVIILDSLSTPRPDAVNHIKYWAERLSNYRNNESTEFKVEYRNFPRQFDDVSCGIFMIKAINLILNGVPNNELHEKFSMDDMSRIRKNLKDALFAEKLPTLL